MPNSCSTAALLGAIGSLVVVDAASVALTRVSLAERDPLAVCNDGTPASYYFHAAPNATADTPWLVFLEGGGWCVRLELFAWIPASKR